MIFFTFKKKNSTKNIFFEVLTIRKPILFCLLFTIAMLTGSSLVAQVKADDVIEKITTSPSSRDRLDTEKAIDESLINDGWATVYFKEVFIGKVKSLSYGIQQHDGQWKTIKTITVGKDKATLEVLGRNEYGITKIELIDGTVINPLPAKAKKPSTVTFSVSTTKSLPGEHHCSNVTYGGSITGGRTVCGSYYIDSWDVRSTSFASGGSSGSSAWYNWEISKNGGAFYYVSGWSHDTSFHGSTWYFGTLPVGATWRIRRAARTNLPDNPNANQNCTAIRYSNTVTYTSTGVCCTNVTSGGSISGGKSQCGSYSMGTIGESGSAGGSNSVEFLWKVSKNNGAWQNITGWSSYYASYYNAGTLPEGATWRYRRSARTNNSTCSDVRDSNIVTFTSTGACCTNVTSGGNIYGGKSQCGSYDIPNISGGSASGSNTFQYLWQVSYNGGSYQNATGWSYAFTSYNPPGTLPQGSTYRYRRLARANSTFCTAVRYSNIVTFTSTGSCCTNVSYGGSIYGGDNRCGSYDIPTISGGSASGSSTVQYLWQVSYNGGGYQNLTGWSSYYASYNPGVLPQGSTYSYRRLARANSSACSVVRYSNTVTFSSKVSPSITAQPTDATVCQNATNPTLTVTASGTGLSYQWQSSTTAGGVFTNITGATEASYTIPSTATVGTTYYRIIVSSSNGCTPTTSAVAKVIVTSEVPITTQPADATVCQNATSPTLSVTAGVTGLSYQWQSSTTSDGTYTDVAGAIDATYTVSSTATVGVTYYRVIVSSSTGCTASTSDVANVTIRETPAITTQPVNASICENTAAPTLTVTATGIGLTYQWQSSTTLNGAYTDITGATASTYTVLSTATVGVIYYRVIVSSDNGCGTVVSDAVTVTINATPTITAEPIDAEVCQNGTAPTLRVTATGSSLTYQWQSSSTLGGTHTDIDGATATTYTVPSTETVGVTYYQVIVSSSTGSCPADTSAVASVTIKATPSITAQPVSASACQNGAAPTLTVLTTGTGLSYQWQYYLSGYRNIVGATESSYTIPSTATVGTTYYRVIVSSDNGCGTVVSDAVTVTINAAPTITTEPIDAEVCQNGTAPTLRVTATGPSLTYQWQSSSTLDGTYTDIDGATATTYTVPSTGTVGITYYQVIVSSSNGCPADTSAVASVTIKEVPAITVQPVDVEICQNDDAPTLTVTATGVDLTYQWQRYTRYYYYGYRYRYENIAGATESSYTIPSTATVGTESYQVIVSSGNGCGPVTSEVVTVTINAAPTIITEPIDAEVCQNGTAPTLRVTATGPSLTYQWQSSSTLDGTYTDIDGATATTYTVPSTETVGVTYYQVIVSSSTGSCPADTSAVASVTIKEVPAITVQPVDVEICQNDDAPTLTVTATGVDLTYQWQRYTRYYYYGYRYRYENIAGATESSYTIPSTATVGTESYQVIVSSGNGCGSVTSEVVTVTINAAPTITTEPIDAEVCQNGTAPTLRVTATGPSLTYQWQSSSTLDGTYTDIDGATATAYTVPSTETVGVTYYQVIVSSSTGSCPADTSAVASVTIKEVPAITVQPVDVEICQNDDAPTLTVTATGVDLTYQWQRYTRYYYYGYRYRYENIAGATESSYTIPSTATVGTESYQVIVSSGNGCGSVTSEVVTVTINATPTITTEPIDAEVCQNGVAPTLRVTATGPSLTYQWQSSSTLDGTYTDIDGATATTYTVPSTETVGVTYYQVIVSSSTGSCPADTSAVASVTIKEVPAITVQPVDVEICQNDDAPTLTVTATGVDLTYQWQRYTRYYYYGYRYRYENIAGATESSYTIPSTATVGTESYQVIVSSGNGCGSVTSEVVTVTINAAPTITTEPIDAEVCQNGTAPTLRVTATGPSLTYQWQSSSTLDGTYTDIDGATATTYTIPSTETVGVTYYQVIVSSSTGSCPADTSAVASVTIKATPSITAQPVSASACQNGANPTLTVLTTGTGLSYQWQYYLSGYRNIAGATGSSYTIPSTATVGTTYYRVIVSSDNGCGTVVSDAVTVTINATPTITAQSTDVAVCQNAATPTLWVTATGTALNYQWQSSTTLDGTYTDITGATGRTYTVPSTAVAGTTFYRVIVSSDNGCPAETSVVTSVTIHEAPSITAQPVNASVCQNEVAPTLTVLTTGTGLSYQWQYYLNGYFNIAGATEASYTIPSTATVGARYYRVVVSGSSGCSTVASVLVSITINAAMIITDSGSISGGDTQCGSYDMDVITSTALASGSSGIEYLWQVSKNGGVWEDVTSWSTSATTYDPDILPEGETWRYRRVARASSTCAVEEYSNVITFTSTGACCTDITFGGAITCGSDTTQCGSFDMEVIVSTALASGGSGAEYKWQVSKNGGAWEDVTSWSTSATTYDPDILPEGETWSYRRVARTSSACAAVVYSNIITFTSTGACCTNITDSGSISGGDTQCGSYDMDAIASITMASGGSSAEYLWQVSKNGDVWQDITSWSTTETTYNPGILPEGETWRYRRLARASSACATVVYSNVITFTSTTELIIIGQPSNVTVDMNTTAPTLTVSVIGTGVSYQWQSSTTSGGIYTDISGAMEASYTIPSTSVSGITYYKVIISSNNGCTEVTSNEASVTILGISFRTSDEITTLHTGATVISLYPNPTSDVLYITNLSGINKIEVWSMNGKLMKATSSDLSTVEIKLGDLTKATYIVRIVDNTTGKVRVAKTIILKD